MYVEKFRVLERPDVLSAVCAEIAARFRASEFDAVAGPTTGGIIIAFEVARQMGLPAIYVETEEGEKTLRRGRTLTPGTRVLIVDDVLTTGTSLVESRTAIERAGGVVPSFAVLIDRSPAGLELGTPVFGAYRVEAVSYAADAVPEWLARLPAVKPGTRKSA